MGATPPAWLIAEREFRAYAATWSFWVALAFGPLMMAGGFFLTQAFSGPPSSIPVALAVEDAGLRAPARSALHDAALADGKRLSIDETARVRVSLARRPDGEIEISFSQDFPLSNAARELMARTLERDVQASALTPPPRPVAQVRTSGAIERAPGVGAAQPSRFILMMVLWTTLTGSLGMLLQAVVRERSNRSLESLLVAARSWEIVLGKVAGVGGVSFLVLLSWLGATAALAPFLPTAGGGLTGILRGLGDPGQLVRAAVIYVLAFGFYGLLTVAIGASARDTASAQNLSRPMFGVLLLVFFTALALSGGAGGGLSWLIYIPPFTPFLLLLTAPDLGSELGALAILALSTVFAGRLAVHHLAIEPASWLPFGRRRPATLTGSKPQGLGEAALDPGH